MKIVLFFLLSLILIGITSYSYAEWVIVGKNTTLPQVFVQMEVRDSNGGLLAYIETDQIIGLDPLALNRFLDNLNNTRKEFLIIDDKNYEVQQWEVSKGWSTSATAFSATKLLDIYQHEFITIILVRHDSFQVQPGDTARFFWTVIRPVS